MARPPEFGMHLRAKGHAPPEFSGMAATRVESGCPYTRQRPIQSQAVLIYTVRDQGREPPAACGTKCVSGGSGAKPPRFFGDFEGL